MGGRLLCVVWTYGGGELRVGLVRRQLVQVLLLVCSGLSAGWRRQTGSTTLV